jgi:tetratricopeptide (TPR) repeat protein
MRSYFAIDSIVDTELKFGVESLLSGDLNGARSFWHSAVTDHHMKYNNPLSSLQSDVIPNLGVEHFAGRNFKQGFAWYHGLYPRQAVSEDPALQDAGYYDLISAGLVDGSNGRYANAKVRFEKCLQLLPNGSDASFYLGIAELALQNNAAAETAFAESITRRTIGGGRTSYNAEWGVSSAYIWLTLLPN